MKDEKLLIIDDEPSFCSILTRALEEEYDVTAFSVPEDAVRYIRRNDIDVVLTDLHMPGIGGLEILKIVKSESPGSDVMIMTAYARVESAIEAMKKGAYDYIIKPFTTDELNLQLKNLFDKRRLSEENLALKEFIDINYKPENIIGESKALKDVYRLIRQVSQSDFPLLVSGESGTGKELFTRAIHFSGKRQKKKIIFVDCSFISENELLDRGKNAAVEAGGHVKGFFEEADGGTIVFDEIGDMTLSLQEKLFQILENRSYKRAGGTEEIPLDVRAMATTNKDLGALREKGEFHQGLFYLNTLNLNIPPLRERIEDIPLLAGHFFAIYKKEFGKHDMQLSKEALEALKGYNWPGNVREMKNLIAMICLLEEADIIGPEHVRRRLERF